MSLGRANEERVGRSSLEDAALHHVAEGAAVVHTQGLLSQPPLAMQSVNQKSPADLPLGGRVFYTMGKKIGYAACPRLCISSH